MSVGRTLSCESRAARKRWCSSGVAAFLHLHILLQKAYSKAGEGAKKGGEDE